MDNKSSWSCTFELEDIEIIDHKKENEEKSEKWSCNQCSLFFLEKGKLDEHKKKHSAQEIVKCKYCNKALSKSDGNSECYENRKCETCEYKCSKCPQRFLRHSSLINHEKKHSSPKKKRAVSCNKKVNGIGPENVAVSKGIKRKWQETDDLEEQPTKGLKTKRSLNMKNSPKKKINVMVKTQGDSLGGGERSPIKTTKRLSLKASKSAEEKNNCENAPVKVTKRLSLKTKSILEDQNSVGFEHKQNAPTSNLLAVSQTSNMSSNENVVNYKPFSCHVCGDTFASDSALLNHIRTHGESAAKCFKCKFCNDEFDDIYKMQYHLAICPLAEDELEYSLSQSVPTVLPIKYSGGTLSPRKRGRPKKSVESTLTREKNEDEWTSSSSKKRNFRKRKSEMLENNLTAGNFTTSSLPKKPKRIPNKESLGGPDNNRVSEENRSEPLAGDIPELTRENEPDDDRKKLHQCPFPRCDFKFTREKALLCHMRNHSDDFDDSLKCHKCDIPFDDIQTLRLHIDTCKGIKEERDDDFNEEFETEGHDSSPLRTFQRMRKDFVCSRCGKSYQSQEKRNSHNCQGIVAPNPLSKKFPCRLCGEPLHSQRMLKTHFQQHHPNNLQFQCPTCNEEFDDLNDINAHMMEHIKSVYDCSVCLKSFRTKSALNRHYAKRHPKSDRSICLVCNKKFADASALAKHRHIHTGYRPYFCPFCFLTFNYKSSHECHLRRHINFRAYKCTVCLQSYFNSGELRKHFRIHTGEKPYRCDVCNTRFRLKDVYNVHMRTHSNIRPHKCLHCKKAFKTRALLRYHIPIHTGTRSFLCPICPVKYYSMPSLRGHIRQCHVTDALKCQICGDSQAHRFAFVDHVISHRDTATPLVEPNMTSKQNKRGPPKKSSLNCLPVKELSKETALPNVSTKRRKNNNKSFRKKQVIKEENGSNDYYKDFEYCSDGQTDEEFADQANGGEIENRDEIEIVEDIKEEISFIEEDDDVQLVQTVKVQQCVVCFEKFDSHVELLNHVYIHI